MPDQYAGNGHNETYPAAGIAPARHGQALPQRHGTAVNLQIGALVTGVKRQDEMRAVGTTTGIKRLGRCWRYLDNKARDENCRPAQNSCPDQGSLVPSHRRPRTPASSDASLQ